MSRPAPALLTPLRPVGRFPVANAVNLLGLSAVVGLVYGAAVALGLGLRHGGPSLLWPAAGVAVAAVVRFGWRAVPGLLIGLLAVKLAAGQSLAFAGVSALGSLTGAALAGGVLHRGGRKTFPLDRVADVGLFAVAAVASATPAALIGTLGLWTERLSSADIWNTFVVWWLGDVAGVLLIAPILLGPAPRARMRLGERDHLHDLVVGVGLAACAFTALWFTVAPMSCGSRQPPPACPFWPSRRCGSGRGRRAGQSLHRVDRRRHRTHRQSAGVQPGAGRVPRGRLHHGACAGRGLRGARCGRGEAGSGHRRACRDRGQVRAARALLEATGRLARIGGWEYVIPDDRLVWSEQTYRIHSVTAGQYAPTLDDAIDFYAPEARPAVRAANERALATGEGWDLVVPFVTDSGRRLWVNTIGQVEFRGDRPYRLFGTFQDVTERVNAERRCSGEQFALPQPLRVRAGRHLGGRPDGHCGMVRQSASRRRG